jgi:hypothetical protein
LEIGFSFNFFIGEALTVYCTSIRASQKKKKKLKKMIIFLVFIPHFYSSRGELYWRAIGA